MIKVQFWEDETIAELSMPCRLFFISLWNFADDRGFVAYRPKWIKVKCFPYDDIDIEPLLEELKQKKRIHIQNGVIKIIKFLKHQKIEKPSRSELEPIFNQDTRSQDVSGSIPGVVGEASPKASEDSGPKDKREHEREKEHEKESHVKTPVGVSGESSQDVLKIQSVWNTFAEETGVPKVIKLSAARVSAIKQRAGELEFDLPQIFKKIRGSPFLLGQKNGWKVDFDFVFCSKSNYLKILEGSYDGTKSKKVSENMKNFLDRHKEE